MTLNAIMKNDDVKNLPMYCRELENAGVDSFIISDLGALSCASKHSSKVSFHISTQASCMNYEAANMYYELGAKRIVCAREMSLADIAEMRANVAKDLEIEAFVHGAMCMAVSGRCLISDYLNDRSANRGNCSQPCRWSFALSEMTRSGKYFPIEQDGGSSFIMSSKDLCLLHHLNELKEAGINSIKIEGRVKKAYYVATVVNAYRQVLDGANPLDFDRELDAVSHRPYSTGFYFGPASQAPDGPEYAQTHELAATVINSLGSNDIGGYDITIDLRNRFYEGDTLEVLSAAARPRAFVAKNVRRVINSLGDSVHTKVADRAASHYVISVDFDLDPLDILRVAVKPSGPRDVDICCPDDEDGLDKG